MIPVRELGVLSDFIKRCLTYKEIAEMREKWKGREYVAMATKNGPYAHFIVL